MSPQSDAERSRNYRARKAALSLSAQYAASNVVKACSVHLRAFATRGYTAETAAQMYPRDYAVETLVTRAASTPATLTGASTNQLAGFGFPDVLIGLAPQSACAQLISHCLTIDLAGRGSVNIPRLLLTAADAGNWTEEGVPSPARVLSFGLGPLLEPKKLSTNAIFTRETAQHSAIESIVRRALGEAIGLALDTAIFSADVATASKPAGILQTAAITATTNGGLAALAKDVAALVSALSAAGAAGDPIFVANPGTAAKLRMWQPQFNYPLLQSGSVAADTLIAVESSGFVSAFVKGVVPDISVNDQAAYVSMDDDPVAQITVGGTVADKVKSLWQDDLMALTFVVRGGWIMRAPALAQFITGASW
jgi:hypothetical protein